MTPRGPLGDHARVRMRAIGDTALTGAGRWRRIDSMLALGLLVAFLLSRILWIASLPGSSQYWEESYRWLAAEALAQRPVLPFLDHQADHYQGGSLVVIGLTSVLARAGVDGWVALKAVALAFSSSTLLALFVLGRLFFGRLVGFLAAAIHLCGPPLVAYWGVVAMGFHSESAVLSLVTVALFLALARHAPRSIGLVFGFGLAAGLSIWFTPTAAIAVAACGLAWPFVAARPRPRPLELAAVAFGFATGMVPWLVYNATHAFAGATRILEVFGLRASADAWASQGWAARAADLVLRVPVEGLLDPGADGAGSLATGLLFAAVWIPGALAIFGAVRRAVATLRAEPAARSPADRNELVFVAYAVVFLLVYLGSRFTIDPDASPIAYRLFVPFAVFLTIPVARSAARVCTGAAGRSVAALALAALATTTLAFAIRHEEPGTPLSLEAADRVWGRLLHRKYADEIERAVAVGRLVSPERRRLLLTGIGWGIEEAYGSTGELEDVQALLERIEGAERVAVERGMRAWLYLSRDALRASLEEREDPTLRRRLERLDALAAWSAPAVVLVTLDTTRVDHLSCYGYPRETTPRLDALAERAVRFRRAWSTSSWTLPAHASLFTGLYPSRHGAHYASGGAAVLGDVLRFPGAKLVRAGMLRDEVTTLAEMLFADGFQTGAFVAGPWLHRDFGLLQGFGQMDDRVTTFGGRPAAEITAAATEWLEGVAADRPYLLFANYFDPHAPYERSDARPEWPRAADDLDLDYDAVMSGTPLDADQRAVLRDRYDAEIRAMDTALGRLLDAVAARPNGWRTIVIVTADHGEALGDGGRIGHGFWLSEELTRVPMIVRLPGDREGGTWREEPVQLVDVLPWVARQIGLEVPEGVEGVPLGDREAVFSELYREPSTIARFGPRFDRDLRVAIEWPYKLLRTDAGDETLTRLETGSLGEVEVSAAAPRSALRTALDAHVAASPMAPVVSPEADPEVLESLRALGYIE